MKLGSIDMSQRKAKKHKYTVFCPIEVCNYTSRHWVVNLDSVSQKNSTYSTKCPKHRTELIEK